MRKIIIQYVIFVFVAVVLRGQAQTMPLATLSRANTFIRTVHNNSTVPMTAYVVTIISPGTPGDLNNPIVTSFQIYDSVTGWRTRSKEVPPGGQMQVGGLGAGHDPAEVHDQLQAAIFADGTTFGDADWVDLLISRRRAALVGVNAVITDLQDGANLPLPDLISALTAAMSARGAPFREAARVAIANRVSSDGKFTHFLLEKTPAEKKINILSEAASQQSRQIEVCYSDLIAALKKLPPDSLSSPTTLVVAKLMRPYIDERQALIESKPPLAFFSSR